MHFKLNQLQPEGTSTPDCGKYHILDTHENKMIKLPCKKWSCPDCGKKKLYQVRKYIQENIHGWRMVRMLTLTLRSSEKIHPNEHKEYLQEALRRFFIYVRRKIKGTKNLQYIRVNEMHKSGYYHLHILIDTYLPHSEAYRIWNNVLHRIMPCYLTAGHEQMGSVNLRLMGSGDVSKSVAKEYITKMRISNYMTKLNEHLERFSALESFEVVASTPPATSK